MNTRKPIPYAEARKKIQSGDILLCSGNSTISKIIKKATKSIWSHVGFVVRIKQIDRILVMESVESIGVRTVPLSQYLKNYNGSGGGYDGKLLIARHDDYAKKPYPTGFKKMSQFAVDLLGYQYDNLEIIRIMAKIITSKYSARKGKIKRNNEYICSEYVYECFSAIGIKFKYDKRGFIAPGDIAKDKQVNAVVALKVEKPPKKIKKKKNEPRV